MEDLSRAQPDRRTILRATSVAAVVAATVTPSCEAQAYDPGPRETRARYRADAPDVRAFYRTNGYETLKKG